jgi:transposase
MPLLAQTAVEELHEALDAVEAKKPTQRLMLAILYKRGPSVPMIADWFDMREETIYRWFRRMEREPLLEAVYDEPRPGRPPKLTDAQRETFTRALRGSPKDVGRESEHWTPAIAKAYLADEFDVDYSIRHVRRLLQNADVSTDDGEESE